MRKLVTPGRALLAVVFLAAFAFFAIRGILPDGRTHVWFLDVGQGDAILIQAPDGRHILVDGGPSPSTLLDQLGEVLPFWDRSLDLVVLTHPDADHVSGLIPLFERYKVGAVVDAVEPGDKNGEVWLAASSAAGVPRQIAVKGMRIAAGAMLLTVLNPADGSGHLEGNNRSVVLRLDYGQSSLLLAGDAEQATEDLLLHSGVPLAASVLKVAHHGSNAGTSAEFLAAVRPRLAVISVGADNRFGHPAPELLERLKGIEVLRTDERGRIELVSAGAGWAAHWDK